MWGIYETVKETILNYTGLSPLNIVIIMGIMVITYKIVSGMFVAVDDYKSVQQMEKVFTQDMNRDPVQLGEVTLDQLKQYDGSDPNKPLLMAIKGQVYDISRGRVFYGPGGPYAMFAGRDATRALALMSFDPVDLNGNVDGLSESELDVLQDWELKFIEKYPKVGFLKGYAQPELEPKPEPESEPKEVGEEGVELETKKGV